MSVTGAFVELSDLAKRAAELTTEGSPFRTGLVNSCGIAALGALDDQFIASIDPYGKAWAPLASGGRGNEAENKRLEDVFGIEIDRTGKPLQDTGRLASSFTHHPTPNGFIVETNVFYARTHQIGMTIRPVAARMLSWQPRGGTRRFAMKVTIPRRQMVPQQDTGGMGSWGPAINEEADAFVRQFFGLK